MKMTLKQKKREYRREKQKMELAVANEGDAEPVRALKDLGGWLYARLIGNSGGEDLPWEEDPYCKACGDNLKCVEDAVHYMCEPCAEGYGFEP